MPPGSPPRIETLDVLRGTAILGILSMNVVSFGLYEPAYYNITAGGGDGVVDRTIAIAGEVLVDQKMMGLFSALFGASIVLFVDRVGSRRRHPVLLSLWRNVLLVLIGLIHTSFWDGDVLVVYGLCAPVLLLVRRLPNRLVFGLGGSLMVLAAAIGPISQVVVNSSGGAAQLGWYWFDQDLEAAPIVVGFVVVDVFLRALGMMMIGIGLYRTGVLSGEQSDHWYRRTVLVGLGVGVTLSATGVIWLAAVGQSWRHALAANAPNTLATAPMTIGIAAVVVLVARRSTVFARWTTPVGRMALTNYLTQTALGLIVLRELSDRGDHSRLGLVAFTVGVWAVQLAWSRWWLRHFSQGPIEWTWRAATYLEIGPVRSAQKPRSS